MMNKQMNDIAVVLMFDMSWYQSTSLNKCFILAAIVVKQA